MRWRRTRRLLRVRVHRLPGGARVIDAGVETDGGLDAGPRDRGDLHGRPRQRDLHPASDRRPGVAGGHRVDRPSGRRLHGVAVRRLGHLGRASSSRWARARSARMPGSRRSCSRSSATPSRPSAACWCWRPGPLPTDEVAAWVAAKAGLDPSQLTFVVAPTASLAGGVQISARILETGLHKMETLGFDVRKVVSGIGTAPIPPLAKNDLRGIGRTNDCILYGGQAHYTVRAGDDELAALAEKLPGIGVARLRHAVLRHLPAVRRRLLQDRPAAVQSRGGLADQHR